MEIRGACKRCGYHKTTPSTLECLLAGSQDIQQLEKCPKNAEPSLRRLLRKVKGSNSVAMPVVQLDYATGEYVGEYPSMLQAAYDLDVPVSTIIAAFNKWEKRTCVAILPKHELMFMYTDQYVVMINSAESKFKEA